MRDFIHLMREILTIALFYLPTLIFFLMIVLKKTHEKISQKHWLTKVFYLLTGYVAPIAYSYLLTILLDIDWRYAYGQHYLSLIEGPLPAYPSMVLIGVIALWFSVKIFRKKPFLHTDIFPQAIITLLALYYTILLATLYGHWKGDAVLGSLIMISVTILYTVSHFLVARSIFRSSAENETSHNNVYDILWVIGLIMTFLIKAKLAKNLFYSLPEQKPSCMLTAPVIFGNPRTVKSYYDFQRKKLVNDQLLTFYAFEDALKSRFPRFHLRLRDAYNNVSPHIAKHIQTPFRADLAYYLLQPIEGLAFIATILLKGTSKNSPSAALSTSLPPCDVQPRTPQS